MAYRNGTYVAFHAGGTTDPTASDIKYYNLMKAWDANNEIEFSFTNSHEKTAAVRDDSMWTTLERRIKERLNHSKNFVLVLTAMTKEDTDCVPFEIEYAADNCDLPIIAAYPDFRAIFRPDLLSYYWPQSLAVRIGSSTASVIHISFAKEPLLDAIGQFSVNGTRPNGGAYGCYNAAAQRAWGLLRANEQEKNYLKT